MKVWTERHHGGAVELAFAQIGRVRLGAGWVIKWKPSIKMIAANRDISWRNERAIVVSLWRLRVGFRVYRKLKKVES